MRATLFIVLTALCVSACQCSNGTNQPPDVRIGTPRDGEVLRGRGPFQLQGQVTDPEELISPNSILWAGDRAGTLGFGASTFASLTPGQHRLRLTATDSEGLSASAEISVTVIDDGVVMNTAPTASIDAPSSNAFFDEGTAITLRGRGVDAEEGMLTGASLVWTSSLGGALGTGTEVTFNNAALGRHRIVLTVTDSNGESAVATVDVEVVPPGTNRPPMVTLTAPMNGATLTLGSMTTLSGSANDEEDGALMGASLEWSSSRDGALGIGTSLSVSLTQGVHVLTLKATDSMGASASAQSTVSVNQANNAAPVSTITAPMNNTTVFQGTAITFTGSANDMEDGALTGMALAWTSSRDGALGTGNSLNVTTLTAGSHVVTLVATDAGGNTGTATVNLTVLPMNAAPTVSISMPANNTTVPAGTNVTFTATANDAEDGALSGMSVRWTSSVAGSLGIGLTISSASLMQGTHTITVTATDSGGRSASANITVVVTPGATNLPPIARITGPTSGQATQALTFDGSTSSDPDGTITAWRFEFSDNTPAVTTSTTQHTFANTGSFTVTLTVTDDKGATASASHTVTVTPFVRVPVVASPAEASASTSCSLVARGTLLHVAWFSSRHPAVWYGKWQNGALEAELVDTLGFNTGGLVGGEVSLAINNGLPFLAYQRDDQVWFATKSGSTWQRERVDSTALRADSDYPPVIAIDSTGRVAIAYVGLSNGYRRTVVATRANGAWTQLVLTYPTAADTVYLLGDIAFTQSNALLLPVTMTGGTFLASWDGNAAGTCETVVIGPQGYNVSLARAGASRLFVLSGQGLLDVNLGTPFSATTFTRSYVETSSTTQQAVAATFTGVPRIVINHGGGLERVWPATLPGFWDRQDLGATDSARIDAEVDSNGDTRACFFRAGKLMIY